MLLAKGFRTEAGGKGANSALAAARDDAEVAMVDVGVDMLSEIGLENLNTVAAIS
ncbi:hypothetical protein [Phyllobacterium endophyticum]|uniref:hypothetical protein n=1 Tax=Phyllobacterium endophyticum TaxID=1149773 RepID=UPI00164F38D0|nr:hypothetical protein [Phyllobacterium endophyticum]